MRNAEQLENRAHTRAFHVLPIFMQQSRPTLKILALLTALQASRTAMLFTWYGAGARWNGIALMMGVLIFFQLAVVSGCLSVSMVWL